MARATKPVKIAGIEFDALISEDRTFEATVPEYATDSGYSVSDAIILGQERLSMVLYLTDTPVTWYERHGSNNGRVKSICKKLVNLYESAEPVKIVTTDGTYKNMAIESITISKNVENGYSREIPISFRKIRVTEATTTTIPSSYGKSGSSETAAGTASTTSASSSTESTSGSTSSANSSSSASSSSESSSKSSVLYSAAKAVGLIG